MSCLQQVGLLVCSFFNALMSAACSVGLLVAVGLTIAHNGQLLMRGCNETEVPANARSAVGSQCPFDNTKIYVSRALDLGVCVCVCVCVCV